MKKKTLLVLAGIVLLAAGAASALVCYSIPEPKPDPIDISALGLDRHKAPAVTDPDLPESNMTLIASLRAPGNRGIKEIVVTPDGITLATSCGDATVKLWDLERRQLMALTLTGQDNAASPLAVTSDAKTLAWASKDSVIHLWNLQTRIETSRLSGHGRGITALTFSPNGELLASASRERSVKLWDVSHAVEKISLPGHMEQGPLNYVTSLSFSPDGHYLASAGSFDFVRIWDVPSCLESTLLPVELQSACVVFLDGGKILAYGTGGSMINLWDVKERRIIGTLKLGQGQLSRLCRLASTKDGKVLAAADNCGLVKLWQVSSREELASFQAYDAAVRGLAFMPDGSQLLTANSGTTDRDKDVHGEVRVWKVR